MSIFQLPTDFMGVKLKLLVTGHVNITAKIQIGVKNTTKLQKKRERKEEESVVVQE
jgi:hypothetical protein